MKRIWKKESTVETALKNAVDVATILTLLATVAIAVIVYRAADRAYKAQAFGSLMSMINDFNALALTNDKCLEVFHRLAMHEEHVSLDEARDTWATFSLLNNRQLHYKLAALRHSSKGLLESDATIVANMLQNPRTEQLLRSGGYDPAFVAYCLKSKESGRASGPT
jgi:hypothetical protein